MNKVTVAGVSRHNGVIKVRFGCDITRVKVMAKKGDTDINLMELPEEMEKGDAVKYLMTTVMMEDAEVAAAIEDANEKYNGVKAVKSATLKTGTKQPRKSKKKDAVEPEAPVDPEAKLADLKARAQQVASE